MQTANRHKALLALNRARRNKARPAKTVRESIVDQPASALAAAAATAVGGVKPHAALRRRLLAGLVPRDLCEQWLAQIGDQPTRAAEEHALRQVLAGTINEPAPLTRPGSRIAALVGPTGVGKTTTIGKLAAQTVLVENRSVALVSLDDQRIGATAQLRAISDLLEIPLRVCQSGSSLARTLSSLRDVDLILLDTAGVSPSNAAGFHELKTRIERAGEEVTVHLCIAAATRQEELDRIIHLYRPLEPQALVATKLDEAVAIGSMFAARTQTHVPFSYVTTGQQIPEDISPATSNLLIDVLLGGELP